jgi:hypothetical protein
LKGLGENMSSTMLLGLGLVITGLGFIVLVVILLRKNQQKTAGNLQRAAVVSDPQTKLKSACGIVFFVAYLNIVLGVVSLLFQIEILQKIGFGFISTIIGLVFLILGYFVKRKSSIALIIAIALFVLGGIASFISYASQGYGANTGSLVARFFLLIPMVQGLGAIKTLEQQNSG